MFKRRLLSVDTPKVAKTSVEADASSSAVAIQDEADRQEFESVVKRYAVRLVNPQQRFEPEEWQELTALCDGGHLNAWMPVSAVLDANSGNRSFRLHYSETRCLVWYMAKVGFSPWKMPSSFVVRGSPDLNDGYTRGVLSEYLEMADPSLIGAVENMMWKVAPRILFGIVFDCCDTEGRLLKRPRPFIRGWQVCDENCLPSASLAHLYTVDCEPDELTLCVVLQRSVVDMLYYLSSGMDATYLRLLPLDVRMNCLAPLVTKTQ